MPLVSANSRYVKIGAIAAIALVVVFNIGYWVVWPSISQPQQDASQFVAMPAADGSMAPVEPTPIETPLVNESQIVIAVGAIVVVIVVALGAWIGYVSLQKNQGQKRDEARKMALRDLAAGLEAYKHSVGHYPVSSHEQQRTLPAVGLGYEWEDFGFPNANEMRKYTANWPQVDPTVTFDQRDQKNQYIYYPIAGGQNFALYAHLESAPHEAPDYNRIDGLPRVWGAYNYRYGVPKQLATVPPNVSSAMPDSVATGVGPHVTATPPTLSATGVPATTPSENFSSPSLNGQSPYTNPERPLTAEEIMKLGS